MQIILAWLDLARKEEKKKKKASGKSPLCLTFQTPDAVLVKRVFAKGRGGRRKRQEEKRRAPRRVGGHATYTSLRSFRKVPEPWSCLPPPGVWLKGQAASAGRRGLSALHHPGTLLPLLQLVVLKQALISRDAVSSVRESQQAWRRGDTRAR